MNPLKTYHKSLLLRALLLGSCLVVATVGHAYRGAGHVGGGYHPGNVGPGFGGYHPGNGYHPGYDYRPGYNYNHVWVAPGAVIVAPPSGYYADPDCQTVQTCSSDGTCVEEQSCD